MIRYVVALPAEARPLIRRYGLTRAGAGRPAVWHADEVSLVVSGVGRAAAAAAVEALADFDTPVEGGVERGGGPPAEAAWINVGVAGHRDLPVGEVVLAHKVAEASAAGPQGQNARRGRAWYPPLVFEPRCTTATVTTVDRPETDYPEDTVYEMEAAGFCAAAARHASAELVQVVKVISDNAAAPAARLTAARVEELIAARLDTIAAIAAETAALAGELAARRAPPAELAGFLERWRFTVTQRRRLERILRRLAVLEPAPPRASEHHRHRSAREVLAALEARLSGHSPGLGASPGASLDARSGSGPDAGPEASLGGGASSRAGSAASGDVGSEASGDLGRGRRG